MNIISANGHPEAFQMVETGRAVAFVMDDILLYSLVAQSRNPKDYAISADALSVEPYGIMMRKDDAAFKKVVDNAMIQIYKSGEINGIYDKWFLKPVPPQGHQPQRADERSSSRRSSRTRPTRAIRRPTSRQLRNERGTSGPRSSSVGSGQREVQLELAASCSRPSPAAPAPTCTT